MNMTRRQETSGNTKPTNLVTNLSGQGSAKKASLPLKMALQTPLTDLLGIKHPESVPAQAPAERARENISRQRAGLAEPSPQAQALLPLLPETSRFPWTFQLQHTSSKGGEWQLEEAPLLRLGPSSQVVDLLPGSPVALHVFRAEP